MNLTYIKNYLKDKKECITEEDIDSLIKEIDLYQGVGGMFSDISKIMKTIDEYNISFLAKVQEYEAIDNENLSEKSAKVREILCILSMLHTYLILSLTNVKDSTYDMKNIRSYMNTLNEKKDLFKSEKMTWASILKSYIQELNYKLELKRLDIN